MWRQTLKKRRYVMFLLVGMIIWLIQLGASGYASYKLLVWEMLPTKYIAAAIIFFGVMQIVTTLLLFLGKKPTKARIVRRVIAVILAGCMVFVSLNLAMVINKVNETIDKITSANKLQAMMNVYVLEEDPAQELEDAADYTFGYLNAGNDIEYSAKAIEDINEELEKSIATVQTGSPVELANALYTGSVRAIIMNEAYEGLLGDSEGFEDFQSRTRIIYQVPIKGNGKNDSNSVGSVTSDPFVIYVSGSDTRSQILDTSRSDVNILMVVNPNSHQILMINTPRDYYVANPAGGGAMDKLTHCGLYGIECSMEALSQLYDVEVNYSAQINFTGFETLVDAVGGITINLDSGFSTDEGYYFNAGENSLDGVHALAFARDRHHQSDGDNGRGRNQMRVLSAIISKMTSGSTIITRYSDILGSLEGMFVTSLSSGEINSFARMQIDDMPSWNTQSYAVVGSNGSAYTYSLPSQQVYVMYQDDASVERARNLIDRVMAGETLTSEDVA